MPRGPARAEPAAALAAALWLAGAAAAGPVHEVDALPAGLELYATETARWESWRFFDPGAPGGDPDYDFVASRLRFGARYAREHLALHAAGQWVQLGSLPDGALGRPGGALGTGALYFRHAGERHPGALQLKYLNAELRDPFDLGLELTVGRFGYASGLEGGDSGVPTVEALKRSRIADRLVGEFGWSHFQRSFDGAWLRWTHGDHHLSAAAFRPTEGGFEDGGTRRIDAIDVAAAAYTAAPGRWLPGAELQLFYLYYGDERPVRARVDNTGLPAPGRQDLEIHTAGAHLVGAWPLGPGELDALAWGALQTGHWYDQDHRAGAAALEAGYRLPELPGRPWLRIGAFRSTGDGDPGDGRHETFFQVLPTARRYAFTAAYNLMNSTDLFAELRLQPTPRLALTLDVHHLRLSQRRDLWYAGAGATQARGDIFGYAGRRSGGGHTLGTAAEAAVRWQATDHLALHAFYGRLWGGRVVRASFAEDDDLDFFFLELTLQLGVRGRPRPADTGDTGGTGDARRRLSRAR